MAGGARISVLSSDLGLGGGNRGRGDFLTIYFTGPSKQFGWWGPGIYQVFPFHNPSMPRVCC